MHKIHSIGEIRTSRDTVGMNRLNGTTTTDIKGTVLITRDVVTVNQNPCPTIAGLDLTSQKGLVIYNLLFQSSAK